MLAFLFPGWRAITYLLQLTHNPGISLPFLPVECQSMSLNETLYSALSTATTSNEALHWMKAPSL